MIAALPKNQALAFVKPHVVRCQAALTYIEDVFEDYNATIVHREVVKAERICAEGLVDQHYAPHAQAALCRDPSTLFVDAEGQELFRIRFERDWSEVVAAGRVLSAVAAQERLGKISGDELNELWSEYGAFKIGSGVYVSYFEKQKFFVLNGFYPSVREVFTAPDAAMLMMVVDFMPESLPWAVFRRDVIGSTNPAAADEHSIRGYMHDRDEDLGIQVSYRENVIHASASPFEALIEKAIWLNAWDWRQDPLWAILSPEGITLEQIQAWRAQDPVLTHGGVTESLITLLEDRETADVADILLTLHRGAS